MADTQRDTAPTLTKADLRTEFGLTDAHIALLGEPDRNLPAQPGSGGRPVPLYSRARVEAWVAGNQELVARSQEKRLVLEARRAREREEADSQREAARRAAAAALREWRTVELPATMVATIRRSLTEEFGEFSAEANEKATFSCILDRYTPHARLGRMMARLDAGFELAAAVRIYICCRVVRECGLELDPLEMAFSRGALAVLPEVFLGEDPEGAAARMLGLDSDQP